MYSPTIGRFMQTDPIGYADGMNIYAYVGNDPVNGVDPTGLEACKDKDGSEIICVRPQRRIIYISKAGASWNIPGSSGGAGGGGKGVGLFSRAGMLVDVRLRRTPQSGLLDRAKNAFCGIGSLELGGEGATFLGAGIRYSGGLAYNTATGDVFLKGSFGGGIGLGGGGSFGLSAQSGTTSAGTRGSLDSRVALGLGPVGGDFSYNHSTIEGGNRLGSQGASGSVGIAKGFGIGYASLLEATLSGAKKLGNLGTICGK